MAILFNGPCLRSFIQQAPAYSEIKLPAGEFEGPFIIDRPLRLVGQGASPEAVTLWTGRGPTIIVRSAAVSLHNLNVEVTFNEAGQNSALWYAPGCKLDIHGAQIQGRVAKMGTQNSANGWNLPDLIDLGELPAKYPVLLPMVIQVPGPTTLQGALADLQVHPAHLPSRGEYQIQVWVAKNKLIKNTMLAGQLLLESGTQKRSIWVIGRVLEEGFQAWARDELLLIGRSGHKFACGQGLLLGKAQFGREIGANRIAEKQAYITKEASGLWTLIQPLAVNSPTLVNRQPVEVGQRRLLKGGETIEVGTLKLIVLSKKNSLPISVDATVDFGKLSSSSSSAPTIKLQNNSRFKKWEGTLRSTVPWIEVPQAKVSCRRSQSVQIPVKLTAEASNLPQQEMTYMGALVLEGKNESFFISAHLIVDVAKRLKIAPTVLHVQQKSQVSKPASVTPSSVMPVQQKSQVSKAASVTPSSIIAKPKELTPPSRPSVVTPRSSLPKLKLDFGTVNDWSEPLPSRQISLTNNQPWSMNGTAQSTQPWLTVNPTTFSVPSRQQLHLTATLTQQATTLQPNLYEINDAIIIKRAGQKQLVQAQLKVADPSQTRPSLSATYIKPPEAISPAQISQPTSQLLTLKPSGISFTVLHNKSSALPPIELQLSNRTRSDWQGTIRSTVPWLSVTPSELTCFARGTTRLWVSLTTRAPRLRPRTYTANNALIIEGAGYQLEIKAQVTVK